MSSDSSKLPCEILGTPVPGYQHPGDAGADLCAASDEIIPARGRLLVPTGLSIALPEGHAGLIWPRSGLAVKKGIDTGAGVIDSQYRGEIKILLFNHTDQDFPVNKGDRIAQLIIQKIEQVDFIPVDKLEDTSRGEKGFGSTG